MSSKLKSRKFWLSVAAFLGSIATSIAGLASNNSTVAMVGVICSVVSAAIYSGCEAYVDGKSLSFPEIEISTEEETNSTTETEETIYEEEE